MRHTLHCHCHCVGSPKAVPTPPPFFLRTMSSLCPHDPILFLLIYPFDFFPILKIRNLQTFLCTKVTGNEPAYCQSEVPHDVDCPQRSCVLSLSIDNLISKFHSAYDTPTAQQQDPHDHPFSSAIAFPDPLLSVDAAADNVSQKVTYLFCDELDIVSKELRSRVRQATKDVVKSEV